MVTSAPVASAQNPQVVINEFMTANDNTLADNTGEFSDWIELHNTSASAVTMTNWTISDSNDTYTFTSAFSIPANGYRIVFASGEPSRSTASELHLPFRLSANQEPLILRDASAAISSPSWPAPGYPTIPTDVSYGVAVNGSLGFFTSPTPGAANSGALTGIVEPVTFSVEHGFYNSTQSIVLNTATPSATIRYTLDGSTPSATNGTAISPGQSIAVSSTSTVRAIAYRTGWLASTTETRTYLFTSDIITQPQSPPAGWPANEAVNNHRMDYGMDPNIVNANASAVANSLTSIPTISIVTDVENLVDPSTGIYVNGQSSGSQWERPASIELIDPTGNEPGFDINAGLRIRGGGSRRPDNPKHSFRMYFRNEYGDGNLEYPLFGPEGAQSFESLGLATGQNGSWSYRGEEEATWIRERWSRETQNEMGQPFTESRPYHLYLNGQYWGLYQTQERVSNGFGVEQFGGNEGDYDVITAEWRAAGSATDGTVDAWASLFDYVGDLNVTNAEFATLDTLVNMENLADYYVLHYFSGDFDGSPMGWSSGGFQFADSNNWRAFRNRTGVGDAGKWIFFDHDSEFTLCGPSSPVDVDNTNWNLAQGTVPNHQVPTPAWVHSALLTHPAYRQIFQDRVALHMQTPGGALTTPANLARVDALAAETSPAIDAEAARWGDSLGDPAHTRQDWAANIAILRQCTIDRFGIAQAQLTADGLWPTQSPPVINPESGSVPYGSDVSIAAPGSTGTLWVTTDGTDPRSTSGAPSATASIYNGPITITGAIAVRARVLDGGTWSPLSEADFTLSTGAGPVRLALNEYNAVGSSKFLGGGAVGDVVNGTDTSLGRIAGNGGDWFELVVIEDQLDVRGWTIEAWHLNNGLLDQSGSLTFGNNALLANLQAGTLLTISEEIPDDPSFRPAAGDWHINLQANSAGAGAFFSLQDNFATDNDNTQIAIFDAAGNPVALPTGEGTVPSVSVNSQEVFKLEGTPTASLTSSSTDYADGSSSTWGQPNTWANGTATQDLSNLRVDYGDVDCSGGMNVLDALFIAQYNVGLRTVSTSCPINLATEIFINAADVDSSGSVNVFDAFWIAECSALVANELCPA